MDPTLILFYLWRPRISQMKWKKVKMLVAQSYPVFCNPIDCSPQGSNIHGIFQARILEWVAISFSRYLPDPGIKPMSLVSHALAGGFFTTEPPGNPQEYWSGQPLPSSGIFLTQGSNPSPTLQEDSLLSEPPGKPDLSHTGVSKIPLLTRCCPSKLDSFRGKVYRRASQNKIPKPK